MHVPIAFNNSRIHGFFLAIDAKQTCFWAVIGTGRWQFYHTTVVESLRLNLQTCSESCQVAIHWDDVFRDDIVCNVCVAKDALVLFVLRTITWHDGVSADFQTSCNDIYHTLLWSVFRGTIEVNNCTRSCANRGRNTINSFSMQFTQHDEVGNLAYISGP